MILLIDNYDSFTYNLYQYMGELNPDIKVIRNDKITANEVLALNPEKIVISPGPKTPKDAGNCVDIIKKVSGKIPILGICLGHQSIGYAFGGKIIHADELFHGKSSDINLKENILFNGLNKRMRVARYHSLIVEKESLPDCLEIIASSDEAIIMAIKHKTHETYGLQFHPESILTQGGKVILRNFLRGDDMVDKIIDKVEGGVNLSEREMVQVMTRIMSGEATNSQISHFLLGLKAKGESVDEIIGGAKVLREKAQGIDLQNYYTVDTCGTGGDKSGTYNISTAVSIVTASGGIKVVKHGNRSVSSKCGSADVLEELGININLNSDQVKKCVEEIGIGFLFAPNFHSAMRHVGKVRKALGVRTIFNILGPLANPAKANAQVLGVYDEKLVQPMAKVLLSLGLVRALVVHGLDGLDEFSISGETKVCELKDEKLNTYTVCPEDFGLNTYPNSEIKGGDATMNAKIMMGLFSGKIKGAMRDILLLNAGAALYVGKNVASIKDGVKVASELIDSKKALNKLNEFIKVSNSICEEK